MKYLLSFLLLSSSVFGITKDQAVRLASLITCFHQGQYFAVEPTGSMKPTFDEKSIIVGAKVNFNSLKVGDMILYASKRKSSPIAHRIVRILPNGELITKGDNNSVEDPDPVKQTDFNYQIISIIYFD